MVGSQCVFKSAQYSLLPLCIQGCVVRDESGLGIYYSSLIKNFSNIWGKPCLISYYSCFTATVRKAIKRRGREYSLKCCATNIIFIRRKEHLLRPRSSDNSVSSFCLTRTAVCSLSLQCTFALTWEDIKWVECFPVPKTL